MFGWKKKKKESNKASSASSSGISSGISSSFNNLLKGAGKGKKASKYGTSDIQSAGSNSPHSVTDQSSVISNGSASPSPSSNSNQITSQFVHSLPPPEYSEQLPPDHIVLAPKTSTPNDRALPATYTPPPGYGLLKQVDRPVSTASNLSRQAASAHDVSDGLDGSRVSHDADRSSYVGKALEEWTEDEVLQWLNESNMDYFADLFLGCDIDGDYLSQITEADLVDLEVEEASLRQELLREIAKLKNQTGKETTGASEQSAGNATLDESESIHFGDTSDDDLFPETPRSPALAVLPKDKIPSISSSKAEGAASGEDQPADAKKVSSQGHGQQNKVTQDPKNDLSILSGDSWSPTDSEDESEEQSPQRNGTACEQVLSSISMPFNKKKVSQWSERDIIHWLDSINLGHLAQVFIDHSISGKELADIDMTLLDEMEIDSSMEREKILSTLYDLTNPASGVNKDDVMTAISHASGYDKQKYMAAASVLQSDDPEDVQLLPPEDKDSLLSSLDGRERDGSKEKDDSKEHDSRREGDDGFEERGVKEGKRIVGKMNCDDDEDTDESDWEDDEEEEKEDDDEDELEEEMSIVKKLEEERKTDSAENIKVIRGSVTRMDINDLSGDTTSDFEDSEDDKEEQGASEEEDEEAAVEFFGDKEGSSDMHPAMMLTSTPKDAKDKDSKRAPIMRQKASEEETMPSNSVKAKLSNQSSTDGSTQDATSAMSGVKAASDSPQGPGEEGSPRKKEVPAIDPQKDEVQRQGSKAARSESNRSTGSDKEEKKKKGGFSKLKEVISPSSWKKTARDSNTVHVWTDVGQSGNGSRTLTQKLTEESSTRDLIDVCLNQLDMVEDPRLYHIIETHKHGKDKGNDRELRLDECPLLVQQGWSDPSNCRLEFRQRTAQGGAVKTVLRIAGQPPKGKLVSISLSTPAEEVVRLALKKFDMKNVDPSLFCLLEVDKDGDVCDVADEALPLQLDSHAFVLCDRSNRNLHWTSQEEEEANAEETRFKRQDSLTSRASSKMSCAISLASSFGSSELLSSTRVDNEKLSKLEKEMASIQESLVPTKEPPSSTSTKPNQAADISPIPELQINDKEYNDSMEEMSRDLNEKKKQLVELQEALGDLGGSYSQMNVEARLQSLEQRLSSCPETDSLPESLLQLLAELEAASQEVEERQKEVDELRQLEELGGGVDDSASTRYELTLSEVALLKAQFDHTTQLSKMEMAISDFQLQAQKVEEAKKSVISPRGAATMYNSLPQNQQFSVVAHFASAGSHGFHFQLGTQNNQSGVYIQSCAPADVLRVGDRVIEVNGHSVMVSSVLEVNTLLNRSKKAHMVVMRAGNDQAGHEVDRLTSQLASASEAFETCWQENKRLSDTVQRLRPLEHQILELSQQKATMQQLHQQIEAVEARNQELSEELRMAHEGNINQSNQAISRLQGDKERLEMKVLKQEKQMNKMEAELAQKSSELTTIATERDDAHNRLKSINPNVNEGVKAGDLIAGADNDAPLWEVLKPAQKGEILHVLQEELEEAGRQKQYLDQLYSLMLERAPELLEHLEQDFEASELSGSEEFC